MIAFNFKLYVLIVVVIDLSIHFSSVSSVLNRGLGIEENNEHVQTTTTECEAEIKGLGFTGESNNDCVVIDWIRVYQDILDKEKLTLDDYRKMLQEKRSAAHDYQLEKDALQTELNEKQYQLNIDKTSHLDDHKAQTDEGEESVKKKFREKQEAYKNQRALKKHAKITDAKQRKYDGTQKYLNDYQRGLDEHFQALDERQQELDARQRIVDDYQQRLNDLQDSRDITELSDELRKLLIHGYFIDLENDEEITGDVDEDYARLRSYISYVESNTGTCNTKEKSSSHLNAEELPDYDEIVRGSSVVISYADDHNLIRSFCPNEK